MGSDAIVITGPTATGKTDVAIAVALQIGGEVISMDSRQVYRGMDIGTAKPLVEQRAGVSHHGFDVIAPDERYSAGRFARDARHWITEIRERNHVAILAGGTGFFLRALTHPLFREPELPTQERVALTRYLATKETGELRAWAAALDPEASAMLAGGRQRLARVVEVALLTGKPISWWHAHTPLADEPLRPLIFVFQLERAELYRRINDRVHRMVADGLVEEVRALLERGYTENDPGMNATGYAELIAHLKGERTLAEAVALTQNATRRYARRQATWLRHQVPEGAVELDASRPVDELAAMITERWKKEVAS